MRGQLTHKTPRGLWTFPAPFFLPLIGNKVRPLYLRGFDYMNEVDKCRLCYRFKTPPLSQTGQRKSKQATNGMVPTKREHIPSNGNRREAPLGCLRGVWKSWALWIIPNNNYFTYNSVSLSLYVGNHIFLSFNRKIKRNFLKHHGTVMVGLTWLEKASVWAVKCLLNSSEYCSQVAFNIKETQILVNRNDSLYTIYSRLTEMRSICKPICKFA